ncbi:MAG: SDR family NAD(P)-dependent oxidoreductase [Bacteroidia bacterium]|nr:SDR family NAD(P)-dependent oxidoreductase [Bacteroidia bacterium]
MQKKVLIIGGTSGLGRKLAEKYIEQGCLVGIIGRRENLLNELKIIHQHNIITACTDISHESSSVIIGKLIQEMDGLDLYIIAASIVEFNEDLFLQTETETIETNVTGFARVINIAYHYFLEKRSGHLITITSTASARGNKFAPSYSASKAFQSSYTEGIRIKIREKAPGIAVTELIPGYIDTDLIKGTRLFWVASVDKAATQCINAISKKKKRAFITKRWRLVYHIQRFLPSFIYDRMVKGSWKLKSKNQKQF